MMACFEPASIAESSSSGSFCGYFTARLPAFLFLDTSVELPYSYNFCSLKLSGKVNMLSLLILVLIRFNFLTGGWETGSGGGMVSKDWVS